LYALILRQTYAHQHGVGDDKSIGVTKQDSEIDLFDTNFIE